MLASSCEASSHTTADKTKGTKINNISTCMRYTHLCRCFGLQACRHIHGITLQFIYLLACMALFLTACLLPHLSTYSKLESCLNAQATFQSLCFVKSPPEAQSASQSRSGASLSLTAATLACKKRIYVCIYREKCMHTHTYTYIHIYIYI